MLKFSPVPGSGAGRVAKWYAANRSSKTPTTEPSVRYVLRWRAATASGEYSRGFAGSSSMPPILLCPRPFEFGRGVREATCAQLAHGDGHRSREFPHILQLSLVLLDIIVAL